MVGVAIFLIFDSSIAKVLNTLFDAEKGLEIRFLPPSSSKIPQAKTKKMKCQPERAPFRHIERKVTERMRQGYSFVFVVKITTKRIYHSLRELNETSKNFLRKYGRPNLTSISSYLQIKHASDEQGNHSARLGSIDILASVL